MCWTSAVWLMHTSTCAPGLLCVLSMCGLCCVFVPSMMLQPACGLMGAAAQLTLNTAAFSNTAPFPSPRQKAKVTCCCTGVVMLSRTEVLMHHPNQTTPKLQKLQHTHTVSKPNLPPSMRGTAQLQHKNLPWQRCLCISNARSKAASHSQLTLPTCNQPGTTSPPCTRQSIYRPASCCVLKTAGKSRVQRDQVQHSSGTRPGAAAGRTAHPAWQRLSQSVSHSVI